MGRQTSQYFCDPVYFLYGRSDFLYGQLFTFYTVNVLLLTWSSRLFKRSTFYFLYGQRFTFYTV